MIESLGVEAPEKLLADLGGEVPAAADVLDLAPELVADLGNRLLAADRVAPRSAARGDPPLDDPDSDAADAREASRDAVWAALRPRVVLRAVAMTRPGAVGQVDAADDADPALRKAVWTDHDTLSVMRARRAGSG